MMAEEGKGKAAAGIPGIGEEEAARLGLTEETRDELTGGKEDGEDE